MITGGHLQALLFCDSKDFEQNRTYLIEIETHPQVSKLFHFTRQKVYKHLFGTYLGSTKHGK